MEESIIYRIIRKYLSNRFSSETEENKDLFLILRIVDITHTQGNSQITLTKKHYLFFILIFRKNKSNIMKTKILLIGVVCFAGLCISTSSFAPQRAFMLTLNNIESLAQGEGGGNYKCTATTNCYNAIGQVDGSVSCEGDVCSRGSDWWGNRWVECDGHKTSC